MTCDLFTTVVLPGLGEPEDSVAHWRASMHQRSCLPCRRRAGTLRDALGSLGLARDLPHFPAGYDRALSRQLAMVAGTRPPAPDPAPAPRTGSVRFLATSWRLLAALLSAAAFATVLLLGTQAVVSWPSLRPAAEELMGRGPMVLAPAIGMAVGLLWFLGSIVLVAPALFASVLCGEQCVG